MSKKVVFHFVPSLGIGGVERNCLILGKGFKDRSIKNVIITNKTMRKELKNDFLDIAENVFSLSGSRVKNIQKILILQRRFKPSAMIFHYFSIDVFLNSLFFNKKKIVAAGSRFLSQNWKHTIIKHLFSIRKIFMVFVSNSVFKSFKENVGAYKKSEVIYNASTYEKNINNKKKLDFVTISRLCKSKNLDYLIKIIYDAKIHFNKDITLDIYGSGDDKESLSIWLKN